MRCRPCSFVLCMEARVLARLPWWVYALGSAQQQFNSCKKASEDGTLKSVPTGVHQKNRLPARWVASASSSPTLAVAAWNACNRQGPSPSSVLPELLREVSEPSWASMTLQEILHGACTLLMSHCPHPHLIPRQPPEGWVGEAEPTSMLQAALFQLTSPPSPEEREVVPLSSYVLGYHAPCRLCASPAVWWPQRVEGHLQTVDLPPDKGQTRFSLRWPFANWGPHELHSSIV